MLFVSDVKKLEDSLGEVAVTQFLAEFDERARETLRSGDDRYVYEQEIRGEKKIVPAVNIALLFQDTVIAPAAARVASKYGPGKLTDKSWHLLRNGSRLELFNENEIPQPVTAEPLSVTAAIAAHLEDEVRTGNESKYRFVVRADNELYSALNIDVLAWDTVGQKLLDTYKDIGGEQYRVQNNLFPSWKGFTIYAETDIPDTMLPTGDRSAFFVFGTTRGKEMPPVNQHTKKEACPWERDAEEFKIPKKHEQILKEIALAEERIIRADIIRAHREDEGRLEYNRNGDVCKYNRLFGSTSVEDILRSLMLGRIFTGAGVWKAATGHYIIETAAPKEEHLPIQLIDSLAGDILRKEITLLNSDQYPDGRWLRHGCSGQAHIITNRRSRWMPKRSVLVDGIIRIYSCEIREAAEKLLPFPGGNPYLDLSRDIRMEYGNAYWKPKYTTVLRERIKSLYRKKPKSAFNLA